jgi:hypothetical protein
MIAMFTPSLPRLRAWFFCSRGHPQLAQLSSAIFKYYREMVVK